MTATLLSDCATRTILQAVKERYQNAHAYIRYARLDPGGRGRMQIAAELPITYAEGRRAEPPQVQFPTSADLASPARRIRQTKIEATPFLHSISVYRYVRFGACRVPPHIAHGHGYLVR